MILFSTYVHQLLEVDDVSANTKKGIKNFHTNFYFLKNTDLIKNLNRNTFYFRYLHSNGHILYSDILYSYTRHSC